MISRLVRSSITAVHMTHSIGIPHTRSTFWPKSRTLFTRNHNSIEPNGMVARCCIVTDGADEVLSSVLASVEPVCMAVASRTWFGYWEDDEQ